jgi:transposase
MKKDVENLPESPELLQKIILDLRQSLHEKNAEIASYKEKYARLIEEICLAKQQRFSPSSERNILQPDLFDEAGIDLPDDVKEQLTEEIDVKSYSRKKHPVRHPLPKYLPREVILHDISDSEKICGCGVHLSKIGEEITEQLKYIPEQLSVIQHVRPKYACKPCQENVKIAAMPHLLLPKSIATPELVAHTIIAKYCDHLPLYRQEAIWRRIDIHMPRSSLCGWVLKSAELCFPLVKLLQRIIVKNNYVQADETTVQVLNEVGRGNTTKSYMWCYRGGGINQLSIVFEYQETRGGFHAENFLSGFEGYLQTDAYSGYNWADKILKITSVGCHAHGRRPFAEIAKLSKTSGLAHEALKFYRKLYAIENIARENKFSYEQRYQLREEKSKPIINAFKKWLDHNLTKTSEQGKIGKAIRYCLNHWADLTNYLKDGCIEIDNNLVENVIRPFALGRKNWMFAGSPSGARAGAVLYSLIETCKANNVEPYKYFCTMLHRIRLCQSDEDYIKLLPQFIVF